MDGCGAASAGTSNSGPSSFGRCCGAVLGKRTGPGWMGGATSWANSNMAIKTLGAGEDQPIFYEKREMLCIHQRSIVSA